MSRIIQQQERHNGLLRCDRALGGDRSRSPVTPRAVVLTVRDFGCLEGMPEVRCADRLPLKWYIYRSKIGISNAFNYH